MPGLVYKAVIVTTSQNKMSGLVYKVVIVTTSQNKCLVLFIRQ